MCTDVVVDTSNRLYGKGRRHLNVACRSIPHVHSVRAESFVLCVTMPVSLLYAVVLVFLVSVVNGQNSNDFTLELKQLLPCQEVNQGSSVSLYQSDILAVQADLTLCNSSWKVNQYNVSIKFSLTVWVVLWMNRLITCR